jgi:hypothetical protein
MGGRSREAQVISQLLIFFARHVQQDRTPSEE